MCDIVSPDNCSLLAVSVVRLYGVGIREIHDWKRERGGGSSSLVWPFCLLVGEGGGGGSLVWGPSVFCLESLIGQWTYT